MSSVKDILIEMKNLSELMVDLDYSSVLFQNKEAAEEVLNLEDRVNSLNYEIKKQSLLASRSVEDAEKLTVLLEVAEAAETIGNAAKDLADLSIKGFEPHPVFKMVMEDSETNIYRMKIESGSDLINKSLGNILLSNRTGMRVISIRRDLTWIYGPNKDTIINKLAKNEITLDEI